MTRHPSVHLANLDLNLLVALRELLRERNVTRAAARIGVTQPAASAALGRLRRHFGDDLLVRNRNGYVLTPLALQLADQVETVCAAAERLFTTDSSFDPASSRRQFTLLMADYTVEVLGARLSAALAEHAPRVELHIRMVREAFSTDAAETIRFIDGMIAPPVSRFEVPGLRSADLFTDRWVCVLDAAHPCAERGHLTPEDMARLSWVAPFQPDPGFMTAAPTTRQLTLFGIQPDVRVRVESYRAVPHFVVGTDRVALLQKRLADLVAGPMGLAVLPCPQDPEPITERLWWHDEYDRDPAHQWLRQMLTSVSEDL
ncbi:LysR family transcriptional regulator [Streptomyces sulfonofaciens]|uniref:LysR family transcriptional regulator n=1 Tax=Streptomyces sulfonofaciens TaxID=68272 RepID=A0A919G4W7_9ACTN|nr:LysR family transcriptional regulator [Streptomyces sulfonofaciens]GHH78110.1 LysR family transcriptional regulator [Streptomyces sulfonofaciens]